MTVRPPRRAVGMALPHRFPPRAFDWQQDGPSLRETAPLAVDRANSLGRCNALFGTQEPTPLDHCARVTTDVSGRLSHHP